MGLKNLFLNIKLSTRMVILVGTLLSAMSISNGIAIYKLNLVGGYLIEIAEEDIPITNLLAEITTTQVKQALELERTIRLVLEYDQTHPSFVQSVDKFLLLSNEIVKSIEAAKKIAGNGAKYAHNEIAAEKFIEIGLTLLEIETKHKLFDEHSFELIDNIKQNGFNPEIEKIFHDIEEEEKLLISELDILFKDLENFTANTALEAEMVELAALKLITTIFIIGSILGFIISITTYRSVSKQMGKDPTCIMSFARDITDGDLRPNDAENKKKQTTGVFDAMVQMRVGLAEVVDSIKSSTDPPQQLRTLS